METLTKIWEWLNGKKTTIGAIILFASVFLSEVIVGIWGYDSIEIHNLIKTLNWIGMPLAGVGIIHKSSKPKSL